MQRLRQPLLPQAAEVGTEGLKVRDFPEMTISGGEVDFKQIPTTIIVRKVLSKTEKQFFSFLCEEGCDYLRQYLKWRLMRGEKLAPGSPIITPYQTRLVGEHIRTSNISDLIRKAVRDAGVEWRPYVL